MLVPFLIMMREGIEAAGNEVPAVI